MAKRRARQPVALAVLRSAWLARVRRTAKKVKEGKVRLEDVERDVRGEVDKLRREAAEQPGVDDAGP